MGKYFYLVLFLILAGILHAFPRERDFPYTLKKVDFALIPSALILVNIGYLFPRIEPEILTGEEILSLDRMQVNWFDRSAANQWSAESGRVSDHTRNIVNYTPVALMIPQLFNNRMKEAATIGVMYFEALAISQGVNGLVKNLVHRPRPYLYNMSLGDDFRLFAGNGQASVRSFYSAHTSSAFCSAVFLSKVFTDIYGKSALTYIVWGTSLSLAGITGYLRYNAGVHFPTDVIAGAVAGGAFGYMIPWLHRHSRNSNLQVRAISPGYFSVIYRF